MSSIQAFIPATPLPSSRRSISPRSRIFLCEQSPNSESNGTSSNPSTPPSKKPIKTVQSSASWENTFLPEFGEKGPGSRPNWDLRPASLRTKDEGKGICDSCKGTGVMTCSYCMGLDHLAADGKILTCPACKSKKNVTCSACFGSKKQIELTGNWWERGVAALFKE